MSTFTPEQHGLEVNNELMKAIHKLPTRTRTKILKGLTKQLAAIPTNNKQTSEMHDAQCVGNTPEVTSSMCPTAPTTISNNYAQNTSAHNQEQHTNDNASDLQANTT